MAKLWYLALLCVCIVLGLMHPKHSVLVYADDDNVTQVDSDVVLDLDGIGQASSGAESVARENHPSESDNVVDPATDDEPSPSQVPSAPEVGEHENETISWKVSDPLLLRIMMDVAQSSIRNLVQGATLVIAGMQSVGKSFLIDSIAGFPITYSNTGAATHRPIRYSFRDSALTGRTYVAVDHVEMPIENVADAVKAKNVELGSTFSTVEVVVELELPGVPNIGLIDTPGFPATDVDHYSDTVRLLRSVISSNPNAILVLVVDGKSTECDNDDYYKPFDAAIGEARPDYIHHEHIVVKNYVNVALSQLFTVSDVNGYFACTPATKNSAENLFVALAPNDVNVRDMNTSEKAALLKKMREGGETALLSKKVSEVQASDRTGAQVDTKHKAKFGVANVVKNIGKRLTAATLRQLPTLLDTVERELTAQEKVMFDTAESLKAVDVSVARQLYTMMIDEFVSVVVSIVKGERKPFVRGNGVAPVWHVDPSTLGKTFQEEFDGSGAASMFTLPFTIEELRASLKPSRDMATGLLKLLDMKLVGFASYQRLMKVVSLMVLHTPIERPDKATAFNTACVNPGNCDPYKLVHFLIQGSMAKLNPLVSWMSHHLSYLLRAHGHDSLRLLLQKSPRFVALQKHHGFQMHLYRTFDSLISNQTSVLRDQVAQMIADYSESVDYDMPQKMAVMATLAPAAYHTHAARKYNSGGTQPADALIDALGRNVESVVAESAGVTALVDGLQIVTNHNIESSEKFNIFDMVDIGGTAPLTPINGANFDLEPTLAEANVFFYYSKAMICLQAELRNNAFYSFLHNQYFNHFSTELMESVRTMPDAAIEAWMDHTIDRDQIEATRTSTAQVITDLQKLRGDIHAYLMQSPQ